MDGRFWGLGRPCRGSAAGGRLGASGAEHGGDVRHGPSVWPFLGWSSCGPGVGFVRGARIRVEPVAGAACGRTDCRCGESAPGGGVDPGARRLVGVGVPVDAGPAGGRGLSGGPGPDGAGAVFWGADLRKSADGICVCVGGGGGGVVAGVERGIVGRVALCAVGGRPGLDAPPGVLIIFQHWFDLHRSGADPEETGRGGNRGERHYFQGPSLRKNRIFGWG